jgi:hypothetical protein
MQRVARGVRFDGSLYDCLFDPAFGTTEEVKKKAELADTLKLFPEYVPRYAYQAQRLAAKVNDFKGDLLTTCENLWYFLVNYIAYEPDKPGIEQVRSTNRLWSDKLGDCDCFAFTISCVLYNLKIKHILRVTQYKEKDGFQHIYVVVPHRGKEIIIDACLERFNYEVPYINKTEVEMDLHFLNGIDPDSIARNGGSVDAQDLLSSGLFNNEMGSIKSFFQKAGDKIKNTAQHVKQDVKQATQKAGTAVKKSLHVINRVNPTTTALRLGVLAGMKTNLFGIAANLRYAYLSEAEAQRRGLNMKRFARYKRVREKLEKIFFGAGGKPENLKEAILTGKGNANREVPLNGVYGTFLGNVSQDAPLKEILGEQMFYDEKADRLNGLNGGLGVVTAAVVTAASGILASIAAILKNIGNLKAGGEPGPDQALDELESQVPDTSSDATAPADDSAAGDSTDESASDSSQNPDPYSAARQPEETAKDAQAPAADEGSANSGSTPPAASSGFMDKVKEFYNNYKTPILIVGGTLLAAGTIWAVRKYMSGSESKGKGSRAPALSGPPRGKGHTRYAGSKVLRKLKMKKLK